MKKIEGADSLSEIAGKYLTFTLSGEQYGVGILKVVEIFGMMNITRVPRCPEYMKGVINLRGKIIPVIDLRLKFGLEEKAHDRKTCIVVINLDVEGEDLAVGMIVDTVVEVRDFDSASIAAAPKYGNSIDTNFIIGMGKHTNGQVTILIDIDRLFEPSESEMLKPAAANQAVAES